MQAELNIEDDDNNALNKSLSFMDLTPVEVNTPPSSRRVLLKNADGVSVNSTGDIDDTDLKFENSSQNEPLLSARSVKKVFTSI